MIELFGRIENVADERYQTVAGYGAYGRTAALGARARF
jgi:vitamin B12 transporter